jgi:DNA-binding LytR/AlgR family response regulator
MNIAVLEDRPADREALTAFIRAYCREHCFAADIRCFGTGEDLLAAAAPGAFDLLFLDIFLPGLSGVETAQKLRAADKDCLLVFITDSPDFTMEGFMVQAAGYVVKPLSEQKMHGVMHACRFVFERNSRAIELPLGGENILLALAGLLYVEVQGKETVFHMQQGRIKARLPLEEVAARLRGAPFLRCNRSYIVNMNYVDDMREDDFLMRNGDLVPIRKNNRREIKMAMAKYTAGAPLEMK